MLKSILNLKGVSVINKEQQKNTQGGRILNSNVCTESTQGLPCGPPHCPGLCGRLNGNPYCWSY